MIYYAYKDANDPLWKEFDLQNQHGKYLGCGRLKEFRFAYGGVQQINGKLTAFAPKKPGNNSFAIFKFDTEENAWTFHKITKGEYLAVSEPSETTEIPITAFR